LLLYGEKIKLRPLEDQQDIEDLFGWWNNPREVGEFLPISIVDRFSFANMLTESLPRRNKLTLFVIWTNTGEQKRAGYICKFNPHPFSCTVELRYVIDSKERNKGYATEAIKLMTEFLFATKQEVEKIQAISAEKNVPSQKALEKNGYKKEALLRKHYFANHEYLDAVLHSILREEWKQNKTD
jgi:RimJ/RimL family protein N-acetyltransferase